MVDKLVGTESLKAVVSEMEYLGSQEMRKMK